MITIADIERSFSAMPPTSTRVWVESQLAKGIHSECVLLTPDIAAELLSRNDSNRKLSIAQMERYATEIAHSNWQLNGEPIIVSKDGKLNDGQHRCAAVVKTGVAINTIIVFGVERETRSTIDVGLKRTIGSHLLMRGWPNTTATAQAAAVLINYEKNGSVVVSLTRSGSDHASVTDVIKWVENNPRISESVKKTLSARSVRLSVGLAAALHWILAAKDRDDADLFFDLLLTGDGVNTSDETSSIFFLRKRLLEQPSKDSRAIVGVKKLSFETIAAITIKAWNSWRAKEVRKLLKWGSEESFPIPL